MGSPVVRGCAVRQVRQHDEQAGQQGGHGLGVGAPRSLTELVGADETLQARVDLIRMGGIEYNTIATVVQWMVGKGGEGRAMLWTLHRHVWWTIYD
jgi:hypothetical protein